MQTITIQQTRYQLASIINQVDIAGKEFTITKFGKPRAKIVPLESTSSEKKEQRAALLELAGIWKDRKDIGDAVEHGRKLRKKAMSRTHTNAD